MIGEKMKYNNSFKDKEIYENVDAEDLMSEKYKNSLIIYNERSQYITTKNYRLPQ